MSLVVRYDPGQKAYRFEFRDEDNPDEVHEQPRLRSRAASWSSSSPTWTSLAKGRSGYSAAQTRDYLVNAGAEAVAANWFPSGCASSSGIASTGYGS